MSFTPRTEIRTPVWMQGASESTQPSLPFLFDGEAKANIRKRDALVAPGPIPFRPKLSQGEVYHHLYIEYELLVLFLSNN